jgi:protein TonB
MFAESLLESPWNDLSRRGWSTAASFALQSLGLGILLMLPLLYTEALPKFQLTESLAPPASSPGPPPAMETHEGSREHQSGAVHAMVVAPRTIPQQIVQIEQTSPPEMGACTYCVQGGTGNASTASPILGSVLSGNAHVPPPPKRSAPTARVSRMMEGNLIFKPQPVYPSMAKAARVQGVVVLRAVISREGTIENLQAVSGHPWLVKAAIDAVRQWRYRPYMLNGDAVEVETEVTVNFVLSGG